MIDKRRRSANFFDSRVKFFCFTILFLLTSVAQSCFKKQVKTTDLKSISSEKSMAFEEQMVEAFLKQMSFKQYVNKCVEALGTIPDFDCSDTTTNGTSVELLTHDEKKGFSTIEKSKKMGCATEAEFASAHGDCILGQTMGLITNDAGSKWVYLCRYASDKDVEEKKYFNGCYRV